MLHHSANPSRHALGLTTAWTAAGVALFGVLPLAAPVLLPMSVVAPLAWCRARGTHIPWRQPSPVTVALLLAGAYLLINASWSQSRGYAASFAALFFMFVVVLHVTLSAMEGVEAQARRSLALGLCIGLIICGAVLCFETVSHQWASRKLMTHFALLRPDPRNMEMEGGRVVVLQAYLLNRSMTALALLLWPAILAVVRLDLPAAHRSALLLGFCPALVAILFSNHATSKIAIAGATAVFLIASMSTRVARQLTIGAWTVATLLAVPIAAFAYGQQLYLSEALPHSAKHRIVIWGYTAEQVVKAPLLGAGVGTTRALSNTRGSDGPRAPGTNIQITTGWHSHNGYLQAWYETGAVGAIFLLGIGLLLLRAIARASPEAQPYLYAAFAAGALAAGSSFSLWAPWFVASLFLAAILAALAARLGAAQNRDPASA